MSFPTVAVNGDVVPPDREIVIDVEVTEQFSERTPAHLRISFTNEAPTSREFLFGIVAPFGAFISEADGGGRIYVVTDDGDDPGAGFYDDAIPGVPVDGWWRPATRIDHIDRGVGWLADPGETTALTYAVLVEPGTGDRLPPGEYRFEGEWGERYDDEEAWGSWGFALSVER